MITSVKFKMLLSFVDFYSFAIFVHHTLSFVPRVIYFNLLINARFLEVRFPKSISQVVGGVALISRMFRVFVS